MATNGNNIGPIDWLNKAVPDVLDHHLSLNGTSIAVETPGLSITYQELVRRANQLATLIADYSKDNKYVAVISSDFIENLIAQFAVLKSGKVVVLLDPDAPQQFLSSTLHTLSCQLIVTSSMNGDKVQKLASSSKDSIKLLDSQTPASKSKLHPPEHHPEAPAYIFYTSGSSGSPKGVIKSHEFIMHDLIIRAEKYQMTSRDRVMITNDLFFARTFFTAFSTLFGGGTLVVKDLRKEGIHTLPVWLKKERITIFSPTGSMVRGLSEILNGDEIFNNLRLVRIGAEAVFGRDLSQLKQCISSTCKLWVNYGSTETGSICCHLFTKEEPTPEGALPVGWPFPNKQIQIKDDQGNEIGVGGAGHVIVVSKYLTSGYLTEEDQKRYQLKDGKEGVKLISYDTGDIGRIKPDGRLELQGRADQMVKIRGYRVNLEYIEGCLRQLEVINEAVVIVHQNESTKRLLAYVVLDEITTLDALKHMLGEKLPAYMMPSQFLKMESLPRLSNGKVDRVKLNQEAPNFSSNREVLTDDEIEKWMVDLWAEELGHNDFDIADSFFDKGGDSISAAVMITKIEKHYKIQLSSELFWTNPTITGISHEVKNQLSGFGESPLTEVENNNSLEKTQQLRAVMEELKRPKGRSLFLQQRTSTDYIKKYFQRVINKFRKQQGWSYLFDSFREKGLELIIRPMTYTQSIKFISWFINHGLVSLLISRRQRRIIELFNRSMHPSITASDLRKCYLFHLIPTSKLITSASQTIKGEPFPEVDITVEGEEILNRALDKGKGVLLVSYHLPANKLVKVLNHDILNLGRVEPILKSKNLIEFKTAVYADLLNAAVDRLKEGGIVKITADGQKGSGEKLLFSIGGFRRKFYTGFAELALLSGATTLPMTSYMTDPFTVTIRFGSPFDKGKPSMEHKTRVHFLVEQYVETLREQVRKYPWQIKINRIMSNHSLEQQLKRAKNRKAKQNKPAKS